MNTQNTNAEASLFLDEKLQQQTTLDIREKVLTYGRLSQIIQPSVEQEQQINQILTEAIDNSVLGFWIEHVDHILGHHCGLLTDEARESYKAQGNKLKEQISRQACPINQDKESKGTPQPNPNKSVKC